MISWGIKNGWVYRLSDAALGGIYIELVENGVVNGVDNGLYGIAGIGANSALHPHLVALLSRCFAVRWSAPMAAPHGAARVLEIAAQRSFVGVAARRFGGVRVGVVTEDSYGKAKDGAHRSVPVVACIGARLPPYCRTLARLEGLGVGFTKVVTRVRGVCGLGDP